MFGPAVSETCEMCDRQAAICRLEESGVEAWLCEEHGYEGQWLTPEEFEHKLDALKRRGASAGELAAYWNWGHRRRKSASHPDETAIS